MTSDSGDDVGAHTFPVGRADDLEDVERYRYLSRDELVEMLELVDEGAVVADLGSGTGFYTRDVAEFAERVYAVDVQREMHEELRDRGVPSNVETVDASVADLPFPDGAVDAAYSTMTHHEYADPRSFAEVARVVAEGGVFVTVDWSAEGRGEQGAPMSERVTAEDAAGDVEDAGFEVVEVRRRPETFVVVARR